jgi:multidrug efflux system outer membrane protein
VPYKLITSPFITAPLPRQAGLRVFTMTLTCAFMLGGCAPWSPQSPARSGLAIPSDWSTSAALAGDNSIAAAKTASSLAQWWQRFDDPLLASLVTQALVANTTVWSAQAALQQARALRDVQGANLLPSVSGNSSVERRRTSHNETSNNFRVGLDASWEPDIFGRQRNTLNASEADALASQASLGNVQVSVAAEVALAYIQLRGQQAQLLIARNSLRSQQETLQITDWRAQAGLTTSLEVEQARTASEQTAAQIPTLQAAIARSSHSLAVLTGQTPVALQALVLAPQPIPQAASELALAIPAQTLRQRPDLRAAELRVSAALARVSVADAARYPSFSLSGSLGLNALTLGGLGNAGLASSLLGGIAVPLFDGGTARAQVLAQEGALEQARASYQGIVLTALKDVEDALSALQGDRARLVRLQNAATAAGDADLLAQQRYASGLIDFQTVLQTQRALLSTQDSVATTRTDISADHVRLYKALGGGWN